MIHVLVSFQRAVSVTWRNASDPGTGDTRARTPGATGSMWRGSSSTTSRSAVRPSTTANCSPRKLGVLRSGK